MTTRTPPRRVPSGRARPRGALAALRENEKRARRRHILITALAFVLAAGIVTAMMLSSRPSTSSATRAAPDFTLATTAGNEVNLAAFRGHNVVLYFNEGAGCGSCLQQMAAIEKDQADFTKADITVLPIVMNTRDQIMKDMATYGVKTPFLLDDGRVSRAYGTLGKGMHEGLPGHSFVLIDRTGTQRWYGEYPSMWLSPSDLLKQVRKHLPSA